MPLSLSQIYKPNPNTVYFSIIARTSRCWNKQQIESRNLLRMRSEFQIREGFVSPGLCVAHCRGKDKGAKGQSSLFQNVEGWISGGENRRVLFISLTGESSMYSLVRIWAMYDMGGFFVQGEEDVFLFFIFLKDRVEEKFWQKEESFWSSYAAKWTSL